MSGLRSHLRKTIGMAQRNQKCDENEEDKCDRDNRSRYTITYRTEWIGRSGYIPGHVSASGRRSTEHFWEALMELVPEQKFLLVAFQVEDWNPGFFTLGSTGGIWNGSI